MFNARRLARLPLDRFAPLEQPLCDLLACLARVPGGQYPEGWFRECATRLLNVGAAIRDADLQRVVLDRWEPGPSSEYRVKEIVGNWIGYDDDARHQEGPIGDEQWQSMTSHLRLQLGLHQSTGGNFDNLRAAFEDFSNVLLDAVRPVNATPPPPLPPEQPPPDPALFRLDRWDLTEPGYATYRGTRFPLSGRNRRLLARLILGRGRAVHADHLIEAAGLAIDRGGISPYISRLRRHLRTYLSSLPADPIPHCDPDGFRLALPYPPRNANESANEAQPLPRMIGVWTRRQSHTLTSSASA